MKSKIEKLQLVELTTEEQIEIDGGSERKSEKQANFWNAIKSILCG